MHTYEYIYCMSELSSDSLPTIGSILICFDILFLNDAFLRLLIDLRTFVVTIYAFFPQIFWDQKVKSADFSTFRMYELQLLRLPCLSSNTELACDGRSGHFIIVSNAQSIPLFVPLCEKYICTLCTFVWEVCTLYNAYFCVKSMYSVELKCEVDKLALWSPAG